MRKAASLIIFSAIVFFSCSFSTAEANMLAYFSGNDASCSQLSSAVIESYKLTLANSKNGEMDYDRYEEIATKTISELDLVKTNPSMYNSNVIEEIVGYGKFLYASDKKADESRLQDLKALVYEDCFRPIQR
jgi:hypothetical protein